MLAGPTCPKSGAVLKPFGPRTGGGNASTRTLRSLPLGPSSSRPLLQQTLEAAGSAGTRVSFQPAKGGSYWHDLREVRYANQISKSCMGKPSLWAEKCHLRPCSTYPENPFIQSNFEILVHRTDQNPPFPPPAGSAVHTGQHGRNQTETNTNSRAPQPPVSPNEPETDFVFVDWHYLSHCRF